MILKDYIKKLQELEGTYGNMECIFAQDPDGTGFYWLTDDPAAVQMVDSEDVGEGIEQKLKEVNAILIN